MKAQDLKIGSVIETPVNLSPEKMGVLVKVEIERVSNSFVWFKYMGLQRIGKSTIDKNPNYYKIISI